LAGGGSLPRPGEVSLAHNGILFLDELPEFGARVLDQLRGAMEKLSLSARAYHRILRVARTIADLDSSSSVSTAHVAEAIQYRALDGRS
jgi:magnesium chelatase family protein